MTLKMEDVSQVIKNFLGRITLFSSLPLRAVAVQYFIHSLATIYLIFSINMIRSSCMDIATLELEKSQLEEVRTLNMNLDEICLNKTTLDHLNVFSRRVILLEEIFIFFALSCFVLNGRKTEKVVSMTCLVTVLLLKFSNTMVVPLKLRLEEFLTHGTNGLISTFLYPFKLFIWMFLNLVSLPLANLTLKGIILEKPFSLDEAIRRQRNTLYGEESIDELNGFSRSEKVSNSWFQYFIPWGGEIEAKTNETFYCGELCSVDISLQPVIAGIMLTLHLVYVIFVLLPGFLELSSKSNFTSAPIQDQIPKYKCIKDRTNMLRFSFDERSHRQSFADEGFGESSSMETVAVECLIKESSTSETITSNLIHHEKDQLQKPLFHQIIEDERISEEISSKEIEKKSEEIIEDIEPEGQKQSANKFKTLIETNFNNQPYICLKTDAMKIVCDKLFTSKTNYFATNTSDELLKGFSGENPCKIDWYSNQKQLANDGLDKLLEWYKEKSTNASASDASCNGFDNDGYSDDESFINGFRL